MVTYKLLFHVELLLYKTGDIILFSFSALIAFFRIFYVSVSALSGVRVFQITIFTCLVLVTNNKVSTSCNSMFKASIPLVQNKDGGHGYK